MPKSNVLDVSLSVEFDATEFRNNDVDSRWLSNRATMFKKAGNYEDPWCTIDIKLPTKDFKDSLGIMEREGCSQRLISHLKYARELGAKWVIFR